MASEIRDNRSQIRRETENFLESVSTSNYSQLQRISLSQILRDVEAFNTADNYSKDEGISGARNAILPMTIAIGGPQRGQRIQFTMLINPYTMNQSKTASVFNSLTRKGYVSQIWGSNSDLISATGTSAAFMVSGEGLTTEGRRRSFAYANTMALLYAYRNNGYELVDPTVLEKSFTNVIHVVSGVEITYDSHSYMGHFNNFTLDENAEKPYLFDYNFEFVISSLSDDYNEVKGHFVPIDFITSAPDSVNTGGVKLLSDVA